MSIQGSVNQVIGSVTRAHTIHSARQAMKAKEEEKARMKEANAKAKRLKEAKVEQVKTRRNFIRDYLSKLPTSLGVKVGDLPYEMQKQTAAVYSPSARQRIMNQMDREAKERGKK